MLLSVNNCMHQMIPTVLTAAASTITKTTGVVAFQVTFSPNTVGTTSTDYFHVMAIGNISKSVIKCMGSSKGIVLTTGDAHSQAF